MKIFNFLSTVRDHLQSLSLHEHTGHPVKNIKLTDMILEFEGGVETHAGPAEVPELEDLYPESTMFGVLPAYAFFIRHAINIDLLNISASTLHTDARKAILTHDVSELTLHNAPRP